MAASTVVACCSSTIFLKTCTHSSQMSAFGPAMSFRTSLWALLQNEHRSGGSISVACPMSLSSEPCEQVVEALGHRGMREDHIAECGVRQPGQHRHLDNRHH